MSARPIQRALLAVGLLGVLALGAVALAGFATPERPLTMSKVVFGTAALGTTESFVPGSVTTFLVTDRDGPVRVAPDTVVGVGPAGVQVTGGCPQMVDVVVHLVRSDDGAFRALSARSTHLGEMVPWRPDFTFEGATGWFREPCHGDTYAMDGTRVFGPAPRGLDAYTVEVEDGQVVVDLGELTKGR